MAKGWEYAEMTQAATAAGGPEQYINDIKMNSYNEGASDMQKAIALPLLLMGSLIGGGVTLLGCKLRKIYSSKKQKRLEEKAKAQVSEEQLKKELEKRICINQEEDLFSKES